MKRRDFVAGIGMTAIWPLAARAQRPSLPVVGVLSGRSEVESSALIESFRKGLRQMEFVEGQNIAVEFRWADGRYERLPALASELANLPVTVMFAAGGALPAHAAKAATPTIPVVFVSSDPVGLGLVASLSHPGGNVTGISNLATDLPSKSTALLKQLMPDARAVAYLVNPGSPSAPGNAEQASSAAAALGIELRVVKAQTPEQLDAAFAELAKERISLLEVMADAFLDSHRDRIVELSAQNRIAGCYPWPDYVTSGGLMSYGTNLADSYRQAGIYVGRILRGEKPSELPVMQPTRIELVFNLKTARKLGIAVPPTFLAIADEVIE